MSGEDRQERRRLKQARQEKRAARAQQGAPPQAERKQARMKRRAERGQETAARSRPAAGPAKMRDDANAGEAGPEQGMQPYYDTMVIMRGNEARREYPDRLHDNCRDGMLFPDFAPKFRLNLGPGGSLFTIGSGFSRDLEPALAARGVTLPTAAITIPPSDFGRPENPLNEYTPAGIAQRLSRVFDARPIPNATVIQTGNLFSDQLMPGLFNDTMQNLEARRQELAGIYARLRDCGALVITLASSECLYDAKSKWFFNRPPPHAIPRRRLRQIHFALQDVGDVTAALTEPLAALGDNGIKVVLVVSPVAQRATFSAADAVTASEISKAVLRVAAHRLVQQFDHVDYFPAYEIARSAGLNAYMDDNVQIRDEVTALLVDAFIRTYAEG